MAFLLDGKATAASLEDALRQEVNDAVSRTGTRPGLVALHCEGNPQSEAYIAQKVKRASAVGIRPDPIKVPSSASTQDLQEIVRILNNNSLVHGVIVQLPLPAHIDKWAVLDAIDPRKDVDGLCATNRQALIGGKDALRPCTPRGICALLDAYGIRARGKTAVIIGKGDLVGKPLATMLTQSPYCASVMVCDRATKDVPSITREGHLLISAAGAPHIVTADMVREGAVVIDVGLTPVPDAGARRGYALVGDVDFDAVEKKASYITPNPGGVGPMTVSMLLRNTFDAYKNQL